MDAFIAVSFTLHPSVLPTESLRGPIQETQRPRCETQSSRRETQSPHFIGAISEIAIASPPPVHADSAGANEERRPRNARDEARRRTTPVASVQRQDDVARGNLYFSAAQPEQKRSSNGIQPQMLVSIK